MAKLKYPFQVLTMDIGGTKIAGGVLQYKQKNQPPTILFRDKIASQAKEGANIFTKNICNFACHLKDKANKNIAIVGIGMGSPGFINKNTGSVDTCTNNFPGYQGVKLTKIISEATDLPAFALNDVQSHTLGEARWGAGKGVNNFVLLAIGTGIGGAVVINNQLMMGSRGYAGELGHVEACKASGVMCTCGKTGHLEAVASGSGIENTYKRRTGKKLTGPEISSLAYKGDKDAIYALELAGAALGNILATFQLMFDPDIIAIGGSVPKAGKIWQDAAKQGFIESLLGTTSDTFEIVPAKLSDDAALYGAAEYTLDRISSQMG